MAYISSEEVKKIRQALKKEFKNLKLSVTREHHSVVNVSIMSSDIDFINSLTERGECLRNKRDYMQVNQYYIEEYFNGKAKEILLKIKDIITGIKTCKNSNAGDLSADYSDYNYFYNINIGKFDKPYQLTS